MSKLAVTEAAAEHLHNILLEQATKPDVALRLVPQPGGRLVLALDEPGDGDQSIEVAGETVLVIAPSVADLLNGSVIDVEVTEKGHKLTINR